jgi:hypothetical protein
MTVPGTTSCIQDGQPVGQAMMVAQESHTLVQMHRLRKMIQRRIVGEDVITILPSLKLVLGLTRTRSIPF